MKSRTTEQKLKDCLGCEERAWAKVAELEDELASLAHELVALRALEKSVSAKLAAIIKAVTK